MASMPLKLPSGRPSAPMPAPTPKMPMEPDADDAQQGEPGDGTAQSGYVTPDLGPFECGNCTHFDGQSACDHPQVMSDPEVNGQVEAKGCCNFFKSKSGGGNEQAQPQGENGAGEAAALASGTADAGGYA